VRRRESSRNQGRKKHLEDQGTLIYVRGVVEEPLCQHHGFRRVGDTSLSIRDNPPASYHPSQIS